MNHSPTLVPPFAPAAPRWLRLVRGGARVAGMLLALGVALAFATAFLALHGCNTPAAKTAEAVVNRIGCDLAEVFSKNEAVGNLCPDILQEVEDEIAKAIAEERAAGGSLLAHHHRPRQHHVRLVDHFPGRDAGETIEEQYIDAVGRVLARRDGGAP